MGFKRNSADKATSAVTATAVGDTPTHMSLWDAATVGNDNLPNGEWVADVGLIDDATNAVPVFDVALGDTLQFDANDFVIQMTPGAGQAEELVKQALNGIGTLYGFFHTGEPGASHKANPIPETGFLALDNLVYSETNT